MTGLPMLTAREVIRALQRAGFQVQRQTGSHARLRAHRWQSRHGTDSRQSGYRSRATAQDALRDAALSREEFIAYLALHEERAKYEVEVT